MLKKILAASPQSAFGELLRLSLEKGSDYRVYLVRSGSEVLSAISRENYNLAILDAEIKDQPLVPLLQNLHAQQPQMRIVVIPQAEGNTRQSLKTVTIDGFLEKPININELMQLAKKLTTDFGDISYSIPLPNYESVAQKITVDTKWIEDHDTFQQNLFRLATRTAARAIFVMKGEVLWAQASQEDAVFNHQVIDLFLRSRDKKIHLDLVKIFRQTPQKPTWLMYATALISNYILIMVFDAQLPMNAIRGHVIRMANGLSNASLFDVHTQDETGFFKTLQSRELNAESDQGSSGSEEIESIQPPPITEAGTEKIRDSDDHHQVTCVLVPRLKQNQLVGDLSESLKISMPQICQDNGWQLIDLTVRPDYLQCTLGMDDFSQKDQALLILRQKLTEMITTQFPVYQAQGEFWVENILSTTIKRPLSNAALRNYIDQTQSRS